jgi:D,D-heptose 1,7-bisphosphate phosphatase
VKHRAVFIDRDGTIIKEKNYLRESSEVELIEGAIKGLKLLKRIGFKLVIITNQSGIKRGFITESKLEEIHGRLKEILLKEDVIIDGIYFSPDLPEDESLTRKPQTKLVEKAEEELGLEMQGSYCIGDKKDDIEMGRRKGLRTILVLTGYGMENKGKVRTNYVAENLLEAALWIEVQELGRK